MSGWTQEPLAADSGDTAAGEQPMEEITEPVPAEADEMAPADDIIRFYAGKIFHGLIPGNHRALVINDHGWIRQEVDDLGQALFGIFNGILLFFQLNRAFFDQVLEVIPVLFEF